MDFKQSEENRPLTAGEVALYCHVSLRAVSKWIASGKLKAYRTPGGHSRICHHDFLSFLQKYDMPTPDYFLTARENKIQILVVDDDRLTVELIRSAFASDSRYRVGVAYDGFEAGLLYSQNRPDLVILDMKMPKIDGFDLCVRIRQHNAGCQPKILAISTLEGNDWMERIKTLGADECLRKPFRQEDLLRITGEFAGFFDGQKMDRKGTFSRTNSIG